MSDGLYSISGFFRNNQPNGLAVQSKDTPENLASIRDAIMAYDEPNDDETAGELIAQLEDFACNRELLGWEEQIAALMVINFLERTGRLLPDEYNGMLYMWTKDRILVNATDAI